MSKLSLISTIEDLIRTHVYEVKEDNLVTDPLVTACVLTYNHRKFIEEAIQGVLIQQTDFSFEILIGDDCSTDGTTEIIKEYQLNYPNKIRLLLTNKNLFRPLPNIESGLMGIALLQSCRGKYIAICEGDDYWTDPLKLQKQVDFLEANLDFTICFHKVKILENNKIKDDFITKPPSPVSTIQDLARENYIHTPSCLFRNNFPTIIGNNFYKVGNGDYYLHMMNAQHGDIYYINEAMAVYRINDNGIWASKPLQYRLIETLKTQICLYQDLDNSQSLGKEVLRNSIVSLLTNLIKEDTNFPLDKFDTSFLLILMEEIEQLREKIFYLELDLLRSKSTKTMLTRLTEKILSKLKIHVFNNEA